MSAWRPCGASGALDLRHARGFCQDRRVADQTAIAVRGLTKRYKDVLAVDDVSFDVAAGSVFAFLGTNGAGKSTTIGCVTTVLPFDAGEIAVDGHDVRRDGEPVRQQIGVVFQDSMLDEQLTARENLATRARFYISDRAQIRTRIAELSELIGLGDFLDRRYGKLSGGQRRRVDIARALLHSPSILFLDEPTAGLDPASRAIVWSSIHDLRDRHGLTVFLTTHYMEETEEADLVSIIDRGKVIAQGTPAQLRAKHSHSVLTVTARDRRRLAQAAAASGLEPVDRGETVELRVPNAGAARRLLGELGDEVLDFEFRHGRMDDVFLALTGREHLEEEN
jgi:multidrug/hemolysin transport system ATP-binding protein